MGGRSSSGNRASTTALTPYGKDNYKTPFPFPTREEADEIARFNFRIGDYKNIPGISELETTVKSISLDKLSQSQENVSKNKVDSLMRLTILQLQGLKDSTTSSDIPLVIKHKNTYQIQDGHHRLSALKAKGAKNTQVRILDLDNIRRKK